MSASGETTPGIPNTSNIFALLYRAAAEHMTDTEFGWLAVPVRDAVTLELANMASTLESAAILADSVDLSATTLGAEQLGDFLFSLANQLDSAVGLLRISGDAADRLEANRSAGDRPA